MLLLLLFQSRNRETYDSNPFSIVIAQQVVHLAQFQSRNRETYDSNWTMTIRGDADYIEFQSRNRETYDSNMD